MAEGRVCSSCGAALAATSEGSICPACLIEAALAESDSATETAVVAGPVTGQGLRTLDRIGAYQILEPLGEGGMGVVYLAEQSAPIRRRVALKLIKLGMDTRQVVARFDAERQALALMDHPNIASVFDAGATDDGRPYFVMEYVPGVPITVFCDRHQLSTRARLELFQQVCAAVQHAHQKGVIHRDLKPSNVLVIEQDGRPMPKVIDFGIAKATDRHLTEKTLFTEHGLFVGTPEYMSPEQADMTAGDVDTRTDIYSLGMLLYELLVGSLPFMPRQLRQAGHAEIQRIIREAEPPKPSTKLSSLGATASEVAARRHTNLAALARDLRGDLDWITLKAIEKDRSRRYASASELAADIGRHLHHEPVAAGPPRASYRLRKFVRKYRGAVAAWAALLALLIAGLAVSTALYVRAERARQEADRHRAVADGQRRTAEVATEEADRQRQTAHTERATAEVQQRAAETQRDEAVYQTYRSALLAADLSLQAGEVAQARQQLQATEPHLRGWEWRYLTRRADSSLAATPPLAFAVWDVRFVKSSDAVLARTYDVFPSSGRGIQGGSPGRPPAFSIARVTPGAIPAVSRLKLGDHVVAISPDGTRVLSATWNAGEHQVFCERQDGDTPGAVVCQPGATGRPGIRAGLTPEERDRLVVSDTTTGAVVATLRHPRIGVWSTTRPPAGPLLVGPRVRPWISSVTLTGSREPLAMLSGRFPEVVGAAFSADGTRVATWSWDNLIHVWDVASQSLLTTLRGHRDGIRAVAFAPSANRIVSTSFDGGVRLWAVPAGTELQELFVVGASTAVYSPSGELIAIGTDAGSIRIWDARAERLVRVLAAHKTPVTSIAFGSDSARLASAALDDRTALLWDVATGNQLLAFSGHAKGVTGVAFRSDGDVLASGSQDGTVRLWNTRSAISTLTADTAAVRAVAFANRRGDVVSVAANDSVRSWDAASGQSTSLDLDRVAEPNPVPYVGFSTRPLRVALPARSGPSSSGGGRQMRVTVYDLPSGAAVMDVSHEQVTGFALSADGARLGVAGRTGTGGVIRLWRIPSPQPAATWRISGAWPMGGFPAFSRDGRRLAVTADARSPATPGSMRGRVLIFEQNSPVPVAAITVPYQPGQPLFLPDGSGLLFANGPNVQIWDLQSGKVATLSAHDGMSATIAVAPDGSRIFTGGSDGTLRVWDAARRQLLLTVRLGSWVNSVAVSPDGHRVAAGLSNGQIQILAADAVTGTARRRQ